MKFGEALEEVKKGALIARAGWNGKGMFVFQRPEDWLSTDMIVNKVKSLPDSFKKYVNDYYDVTETNMIKFCAYLCMKDANDNIVNGWLASQSDMLADDWMVVGYFFYKSINYSILKITVMKTKEEKQKKFVTEFEINGEKYGGYIYATTFSEAEDFVRQRKATEKVVGGPCLEQEEINRLYNHSS